MIKGEVLQKPVDFQTSLTLIFIFAFTHTHTHTHLKKNNSLFTCGGCKSVEESQLNFFYYSV